MWVWRMKFVKEDLEILVNHENGRISYTAQAMLLALMLGDEEWFVLDTMNMEE